MLFLLRTTWQLFLALCLFVGLILIATCRTMPGLPAHVGNSTDVDYSTPGGKYCLAGDVLFFFGGGCLLTWVVVFAVRNDMRSVEARAARDRDAANIYTENIKLLKQNAELKHRVNELEHNANVAAAGAV